ncbi:hypothetical protein [Bradyrhizobium nanningense]|uniref:hypothetical protein n=1 Tax=Bradyrhizobium nanningense TaxID=1325118 RepID=UPI001008C8CB|nr:hypothetical protein [Bradyrhizobium nanningense]RXH34363.1 hypothetical protein XH84_07000 [Bradyrhizobium nanningense]
MRDYDPANGNCQCQLDVDELIRDIAARRWVHEFRERKDNREMVLVWTRCNGIWDHRWTDEIVESCILPQAEKTRR